ncbi:ABC transporter ATP-binding protein, partial [Bifidobacterium apousia]
IGPFQVLDDHQILIRQENLEPGPINRLLVQEGILVNQISQQKGSLEEYFTDLLNKTLKSIGGNND